MLTRLTDKVKLSLSDCLLKIKQRQFNILLFDSIDQLNESDWRQVTETAPLPPEGGSGMDTFWSAGYHSALEKGCTPNVSFRYLLIYDKDKPVAACYFQVIDLKNLSLKTALNQNYFLNIYSKMDGLGDDFAFGKNGDTSSLLCVCGNLFASGSYGIASHDSELLRSMKTTFPKILRIVEDSLQPRSKVFATLLKDFETTPQQFSGVFEHAGFIPFQIDPDMILQLDKNWKTYDDYLNALSSKYRIRANNAEAKSRTLTIKNFSAPEIKKHSGEITHLFNAVLHNAPVRIAGNTANYFYHLKTNLQDRFCFKAFFNNDKLIAFSTAVINDDLIHAHHIGMDYVMNRNFSLYQNILYTYVKDAIEHKVSRLNFGRDALEIKSTVGAIPQPLMLFVRFSNSFTHLILESFMKLTKSKEWTQRRPFKEVRS